MSLYIASFSFRYSQKLALETLESSGTEFLPAEDKEA